MRDKRDKREKWDEYEEELSPKERRERDSRRAREEEEQNERERRERRERSSWRDEEFEEPPKKAPLFLRIIAWLALVCIFFAVGYGGTNLLFKWMDSRGSRPEGVVSNTKEAEQFIGSTKSADVAPEKNKACIIYIPDGSTFEERQIKTGGGIPEDDISEALAAYLDAMKENQWFDPGVQSLNVFCSGEWLYVNMNDKFWTSLKALGKDKSRLALTGLVQTISQNFSPIVKVKFYVDGKERKDKEPVDLSLPWKLPGKS